MGKLTDILKKTTVGLAIGLATHCITIYACKNAWHDDSGVVATERAYKNFTGCQGRADHSSIGAYTDSACNRGGLAAFFGPILGVAAGYVVGRRVGRKRKEE